MNKITKEVKIALVAIVGLVVLFFGLQFLKGLNLFSDTNSYHIVFKNISGMGSNTAIYANGYKVGYVSNIEYDFSGKSSITVTAQLDKGMRLPKGTIAEIDKDLMGNMQVNLIMPEVVNGELEIGGTMEGRLYSGALDKASAMIPDIQRVVLKLDSILGAVNEIMQTPALRQSLNNVNSITTELNGAARDAHALVGSVSGAATGLLDGANNVVKKADNAMGYVENAAGNLSKVDVSGTMASVKTAIESADAAIAKLDSSMDDINKLTTALTDKNGTLGLLMNDNQLYTNLSNTAKSADSLLIDLKSHPKRYVHFSIFGKKDK